MSDSFTLQSAIALPPLSMHGHRPRASKKTGELTSFVKPAAREPSGHRKREWPPGVKKPGSKEPKQPSTVAHYRSPRRRRETARDEAFAGVLGSILRRPQRRAPRARGPSRSYALIPSALARGRQGELTSARRGDSNQPSPRDHPQREGPSVSACVRAPRSRPQARLDVSHDASIAAR